MSPQIQDPTPTINVNENSLQNFESYLTTDQLSSFTQCHNSEWTGKADYKGLFNIWYRLKHPNTLVHYTSVFV